MMLSATLWAFFAFAPAADAQTDDAYVRAVAQRVAEHMQSEHYAAALREIEAAANERPLPDFVFMRAVVEETRGNCRAAVPLYDRFLATDPLHEDAQVARAGLVRCGSDPEPTPEPAPTELVPPPSSPPAKPWYSDPGGGVLVIGGTVALGVGLGLFVQARADERAAERADTLADHQRFGDRSRRLGIAAVTVLATGGALVLGGVVRYVVVGRRARNTERRVVLGPGGVNVRF